MTESYRPPFTSTPLAGEPTMPMESIAGMPTVNVQATTVEVEADPAGQSSTTDVAKGQAAEVGQGAAEAGKHVAGVAKDQASTVVSEAGSQAKQLLGQTRSELTEQAGQQQQRLAGGLRSLSEELRSMAQNSDQPGVATDLAHQAAQRSQSLASWLEGREPGQLVTELKSFARQRPGTFLLVAAGVGLLAGRLTRGLKDEAAPSGGSQQSSGANPEVPPVVGLPGGAISDRDVVRPYASSDDGGAGFRTDRGAAAGYEGPR
jgi:ElaB/YqjD/DUF883 family membrane-anchored ribosome-binding protein